MDGRFQGDNQSRREMLLVQGGGSEGGWGGEGEERHKVRRHTQRGCRGARGRVAMEAKGDRDWGGKGCDRGALGEGDFSWIQNRMGGEQPLSQPLGELELREG